MRDKVSVKSDSLANNKYGNAENTGIRERGTFFDAVNRGGETEGDVEATLTAIQANV